MVQSKQKYSFQCDLCDAIVSRKDILLRHMEIHSGVKFNCTECDAKYSRNDKLVWHVRTKHRSLEKKIKVPERRHANKIKLSTSKGNNTPLKEKLKVIKVLKRENPKAISTDLTKYTSYRKKKRNFDKWNNGASILKGKASLLKHKIPKQSTPAVSGNETGSNTEQGLFSGPAEMNSNHQDVGEFIIDALYVKGDQLNCKASNMECFETDSVLEMKAHREKYHMLLEQRFAFETWRHLLPERFLKNTNIDQNKSMERLHGDIDVLEKIRNARKDVTEISHGNVKKTIEDPIRKDFSDYLVKVRSRCFGQYQEKIALLITYFN